MCNRLFIGQLGQAGLHHRVRHRSAGRAQRVIHRCIGKAALPVFKTVTRLVVGRVADLGNTLAIVAVVPAVELLFQGLIISLVRAGIGLGVKGQKGERKPAENT